MSVRGNFLLYQISFLYNVKWNFRRKVEDSRFSKSVSKSECDVEKFRKSLYRIDVYRLEKVLHKFPIFPASFAISRGMRIRVALVWRCLYKVTVRRISLSEVGSGKRVNRETLLTWHRLHCRRWSALRPRWTPNWMSSKSTCWGDTKILLTFLKPSSSWSQEI